VNLGPGTTKNNKIKPSDNAKKPISLQNLYYSDQEEPMEIPNMGSLDLYDILKEHRW
jgi:hypothetical protein